MRARRVDVDLVTTCESCGALLTGDEPIVVVRRLVEHVRVEHGYSMQVGDEVLVTGSHTLRIESL